MDNTTHDFRLALPRETARVRAIMRAYQTHGIFGLFAVFILEQALSYADRALASGDPEQMARAYKLLCDIPDYPETQQEEGDD